ncbi:enolase C-terminal domain-like protein [Nesterenkonia massiliensis]|uniref:enolase C-terminal domain-like protein n=1 Tax=Nesterenkonia massiliensis TaxID=1232429 RepID=UPI0003FD7D8B|nr:enolase C-terminal domain-like protein [Nesterenkonia massiliensis]
MTDTSIRRSRISRIEITPVAFSDPPLLNVVGVHEEVALRSVVQMHTDDGLVGLGESYGDAQHLARMQAAADAILGEDPFNTQKLRLRVAEVMSRDTVSGGHGMSGMVTGSATADRVFSPFEVAALDIQGQALKVPVSTLLGGALRDQVEYSGYLFYKWAGHPDQDADPWGEAMDPEGLIAQAHRMVDGYGFRSLKLKGGVLPPEEEAEAIEALRAEFPDVPLRLDPNGAWTVETSVRIGKRLEGLLEYLEDPTPGRKGMAEVRRQIDVPLATNMCVVSFADIPEAIREGSVDIILSDHHFWGGLRRSQELAGHCETFGLHMSMHSNSHLGISLAAMTHLASATPRIDYACDTHWPWKQPDQDVVALDSFTFDGGCVRVPQTPGLGVELDEDLLQARHEAYVKTDVRERNDTGYMQKFHPNFDPSTPRW